MNLGDKCAICHVGTPLSCPTCRVTIDSKVPVVRRQNRKYTDEDRKRIIECAANGQDWESLSVSLGIKKRSAEAWIKSGREKQQRGGNRRSILNPIQGQQVVTWVEEDCQITLRQLQIKILNHFREITSISIPTISNYLNGKCFSVKKVHYEPQNMNNENNKALRRSYVRQLNEFIQNNH